MRCAIYGAGAMGTVLGAYIARAGKQIDLINRNEKHIAALKEKGARIVGTVEFTQKVNALLPSEMQGKYDIILLMTKQRANAEIVTFLKDYLAEDGALCTCQNGLPEPKVAGIIGEDRTLGFTWQDVTCLSLVNVSGRQQSGFKPGGNACVDFFETPDGKVDWECITLFDAAQKNFQAEWQKAGCRLIWRLFKGDVLELSFSDAEKRALGLPPGAASRWFVVQMFSEGKLQVRRLQDARPLQEKDGETSCWLSGERGRSFYTRAQARKVELSPFGKVLHKHRKLWYGKKAKKS